MSYIITYEYDPCGSDAEAFGPYESIDAAFDDIRLHFPEAEIHYPTHARMMDELEPPAVMLVIEIAKLETQVPALRQQLYEDHKYETDGDT
jgi:hypothetical protein